MSPESVKGTFGAHAVFSLSFFRPISCFVSFLFFIFAPETFSFFYSNDAKGLWVYYLILLCGNWEHQCSECPVFQFEARTFEFACP